MPFGVVGGPQAVVVCLEFHQNQLPGLEVVRIEICYFPLHWPLAYTTACTTVQAVIAWSVCLPVCLPVCWPLAVSQYCNNLFENVTWVQFLETQYTTYILYGSVQPITSCSETWMLYDLPNVVVHSVSIAEQFHMPFCWRQQVVWRVNWRNFLNYVADIWMTTDFIKPICIKQINIVTLKQQVF